MKVTADQFLIIELKSQKISSNWWQRCSPPPWLTTSRLRHIRNITTRLRKDKKTKGNSKCVTATKEWIE